MEETVQRNHPFRIVVGFDFSPQARLALKRAVGLARGFADAEIHVVSSLDTRHLNADFPRVEATFAGSEAIRSRVQKEAQAVLAEMQPPSVHLFVHTRIKSGAGDAILEVAEEVRGDMILVGTHSKQRLSRLVLGSVSERVVREAHCPVLVLRETDYGPERPRGTIEPPCAACLRARTESRGAHWWCKEHDHAPPYASPLRSHHTSDPEEARKAAWVIYW